MQHQREKERIAAEAALAEKANRELRAALEEIAARRAAELEAEARAQHQRTLVLAEVRRVAVGAGIVHSNADFDRLSEEERQGIESLVTLADELQTDLAAALDQNASADAGVAVGRPLAAGASVASFLGGYSWAGGALAVIAMGARFIASDYKQAMLSEFRAKWFRKLSPMDMRTAEAFATIFAFKYPLLANRVGEILQGQIAQD